VNTFLSAAQESQVEQYRAFVREVLIPDVARDLAEHKLCLKEFLQQAAQKGYLGINVPKEYGGQGGSLLESALFCEAVGRAEPGLALTLGNHAAVIELLKLHGSDQQKSRYLPTLARGEGFATLAFSEETAGTDYAAVQTTLQDGILTGLKQWVITGDFATLFLVLAKEAGKNVLVLVERPTDNTFKLVRERRLMGLRSAYVNDIEFVSAKIPADNRMDTGSDCERVALHALTVAKVILCAGGLGLMEQCGDVAVEHARQRQQFGQGIGQFQGVQWKLADMSVAMTGSRLQVYRAAWSHDNEAESFIRYAAMCNFLAARSARFHSGEAVQILGASGIVEDGVLARFYDDAKVMEIALGTAEFQKMTLTKELNI
jgi:alkylation response protein AidB-like acyl-CoA dehydrogenase